MLVSSSDGCCGRFSVFVVTFVTYLIFYVTPADPARLVAGQGASPAEVQKVAERLHLNDPVWTAVRLLHQEAGVRAVAGGVVQDAAGGERHHRRRAPVTASLVFGGAIFWLTLSIPIGILSALKAALAA